MKILMVFAAFLIVGSVSAVDFKPADYNEVKLETAKTMPQDYYNKKIKVTGTFSRILPTPIPEFIEKQFDEKRYLIIQITPSEWRLPVVIKKTSDLAVKFMEMDKNSSLIMYGKVKKFRYEANKGRRVVLKMPEYYLDLYHVEVIASTNDSKGWKQQRKEEKVERKRRRRNP